MAFNSFIDHVKDESLSCTTTVPEFTPGVKTAKNGFEYCYVYNAAVNSKILTGQFVLPDLNNGTSSTSGFSVSVTLATSNTGALMAGVAQQTFLTGTYGWIMTKGVSLIALDVGEISMDAGDKLGLGVNGGFVSSPVTASTGARFGYMINSGITAATGKGRIVNCVF